MYRYGWRTRLYVGAVFAAAGCGDMSPEFDDASIVGPYPLGIESQCGPTLDLQDVERYDGTYGVSVDFVARKQPAVGQIQWESDLAARYASPGNVSGVRWCSGTLIAPNIFITAGHCFTEGGPWIFPRQPGTSLPLTPAQAALEMQVNFNYQVDPSGTLRTEQSFDVVELIEHRNGGLDYAIVRLQGQPGQTYGMAPLAYDVTVAEHLAIIGHPNGWPKKVSAGTLASTTTNWLYYGDLDTLGGNSGSGVLQAASGAIVAIHTNGGCTLTGGFNSGVRTSAIFPLSPRLQSLARSDWAFIWVHGATGSGSGFTTYSRNSSGGPAGDGVINTFTNLSTGRYRVDFPNLGDIAGGNFQVTAYGSGNERCNPEYWSSSGSTLQLFVRCFTPTGMAVNTRFVASYVREGTAGGFAEGAYLWSDSPSSATSTPAVAYQRNSSGALNRIERFGTGAYRAILPGQAPAPNGGTVQVTAYGAGGGHCKVGGWGPSGSSMVANVYCFNAAGVAADGLFTLHYSPRRAAGGWSGGYGWASDSLSASYTLLDYWEYIEVEGLGPSASHVTGGRSGAGLYNNTFPGLVTTGSSALVTAYGASPEYCKVVSWGAGSGGATVNIACFDAVGAPANTHFVSGYATTQVVP